MSKVIAGRLAARINVKLDEVLDYGNKTMEACRDAGAFLENAREQVPHGEWGKWLTENIRHSARTCRRCMAINRDWELMVKEAEKEGIPLLEMNLRQGDEIRKRVSSPKLPSRKMATRGQSEDRQEEPSKEPVQGTLLPADTEPKEGFDGYNNDEGEPEEVDTRNYAAEFMELWKEADADAKQAIVDVAFSVGSFRDMFVEKIPSKKPVRKKSESAPKKSTKKNKNIPTLLEVIDYCKERNNRVQAHEFMDYYESQGWKKANGRPVVSWKACVRQWEKDEHPAGSEAAQAAGRDVKKEERLQRMKARNASRKRKPVTA